MKSRRLNYIWMFILAISLLYINPTATYADSITVTVDEVNERSIMSTSQPIAASKSYEMIRTSLLAGEREGKFDPAEITYKEVGSLIRQVTEENPEIMYYDGATLWSSGKIEYNYKVPTDVVRSNQLRLQSKVDDVLALIIKTGQTDFDKVKAIHDYLALTIAYDYDNFLNDTVPADSYTAYGALVKGIAVCDGYTKASQLLMNRLGIENEYVFGYGNGGAHSWNLVYLDGEPYFMDITWDDPVPNTPNYVRYKYFLVTSAQLSKDHSWEKVKWPVATSTKYSYFTDFGKTIEREDYYLYRSQSDGRIYKINKNGTGKKRIIEESAPFFDLHQDWIYFSNYSHSGYLFKIKIDGSGLEQLNEVHTTDIVVKGDILQFYNNKTGHIETIKLESGGNAEEPSIVLKGDPVKANKMWTVTFNQEFDFASVTGQTVTVKNDKGSEVPVTFGKDATGTKLLVFAPSQGYEKNVNYTLTVENVKSFKQQVLKEKAVKQFHVK
ncbi:DUF5050 domain-containing protein [Sporosarcina sp. 179-K 3D1 HS]|uniref:DUF5050 domain-containing protein n=1 Tax=Sporosarcina sp. 179-K 3D1 HS TaxID=3232169 RepID=UPI0039A1E22F